MEINPRLDTNKNGSLELETELTPQVFGGILDAGFAGFFGIYAPGRALPTLLEAARKCRWELKVYAGLGHTLGVAARAHEALKKLARDARARGNSTMFSSRNRHTKPIDRRSS